MSSLAAARADNFYFPPKWTPEAGSLNKFHGVPPGHLGVRAKKMHLGILVIRYITLKPSFSFWLFPIFEPVLKSRSTFGAKGVKIMLPKVSACCFH